MREASTGGGGGRRGGGRGEGVNNKNKIEKSKRVWKRRGRKKEER